MSRSFRTPISLVAVLVFAIACSGGAEESSGGAADPAALEGRETVEARVTPPTSRVSKVGATPTSDSTAQAPAATRGGCGLVQLTRTVGGALGNAMAAVSASGRQVAFVSDIDLTGGNSAGQRQVFLLDASTLTVEQVTTSGSAQTPVVSGDGAVIAFVSDQDHTGGGAAGGREVFLFDRGAQRFARVTDGNRAPGVQAAISDDGSTVVLTANVAGNLDVHTYDVASNRLTDITPGSRQSQFSDVSGDGRHVAFFSLQDLAGDNSAGRNHLFLADLSSRTPSFAQITKTSVSVINNLMGPSLSADGSIVAFSLAGDPDGSGLNADANPEIFVYDAGTGGIAQVTDSLGAGPLGGGNVLPSISGDGRRVAFISDRDLSGDNPTNRRQVFVYHSDSSSITQLTTGDGPITSPPSISGDGQRLVFGSRGDPVGGNADGNSELFMAERGG